MNCWSCCPTRKCRPSINTCPKNARALGQRKVGFRVVSCRVNSLVLQSRHPMPVASGTGEQPDDEDDVSHSRRANAVLLCDHSHGVADWARWYAIGCGIEGPELEAIECAALLHDVGKADPLFQRAMHGNNHYYDPTLLLAKSPGARRPPVRHELMSVRMAESNAELLPDDPDARDLALHLIASHHGYCRPFAPFRDADLEPRAAEFEIGRRRRCKGKGRRVWNGWTPAWRNATGA